MSLSLTLLGGFAIEASGTPLPLPARKARALLAALALARHRSMTRARLARLLWGGQSASEQARGSLRQTLTRIRRAGIEVISPDPDSLSLPETVEVDVDAFLSAMTRHDAAEAIRCYRGDLLDGLSFRDPSIEDWLERERERLRGLAIDACTTELDRLGDRTEAAALAHRLLELDPLRERAHRTLMQLDVARGDTSAALSRFSALRDLLHRELQTMPEAETIAVADRIRSGRPLRSSRAAGVRSPERSTQDVEPTDVHLRQVIVLAALAAEDGDDAVAAVEGDWSDGLADAVVAAGGSVTRRDTGQLVAVWGLEQTRGNDALAAADVARSALAQIGGRASMGLAEGRSLIGGTSATNTRYENRALRLAATASPGDLALEPAVAERIDRSSQPDSTLVGREAELAQILGATRATLGDGRGIVIHLGGEAGIGKTRLAREVAAELAADGTPALWVGYESFGDSLHLGQQIARSLADPEREAFDDPFDQAILATLEGRPLTVGDRLRLESLVPEERLRREIDVTEALLAAVSKPNGLLLVVEDCHWARHVATIYLLRLTDAAARVPVAMLLSERPSEENLGPRLATRARVPLVRLSLAPLSAAAAERLARTVGAGERRTRRALELAAGHPLFLLRLLDTELADDRLPSTIGSLVQEQLERLPERERTALRQASILGRRFSAADVEAIFRSPPPSQSGDLLVTAGDRCLFGHDLVHRAVYESVPDDMRRHLHGRAAAYYRERDALLWADHAALSEDAADATRAAAAAANAMIAARRFAAALPYVEDGLACDADPEAVAELHSCRAAIRRIRGDLHGALEDYRAAHARAFRDATRASMLTRMALVLHRLGRRVEADRSLDDADEIVDRAGIGGTVRAEIQEQRGNLAFSSGDHAACERHHTAALSLAVSADDRRAVARAEGGLGDAAYAAGRMRSARAHYERAIGIARAEGFGMVIEDFGSVYAYTHHLAEPGLGASTLADLAITGARDSGADRNEIIATMIRADIRLTAFDLGGAAEDLDRIATLQSRVGEERRPTDDLAALRALLAFRRGDRIESSEGLTAHDEGDPRAAHAAGFRLGVIVLAGDESASRQAYRAGRDRADGTWLAHGVIRFHRLTLERALRDGDRARARADMETLRACTAEEPLGWVDLAIENAELHLSPDVMRERAFVARAEAAGVLDLLPCTPPRPDRSPRANRRSARGGQKPATDPPTGRLVG